MSGYNGANGKFVAVDVQERFWAKVRRGNELDACWLWAGGQLVRRGGQETYGRFFDGKRNVLAHRFSFELAHGARIADGYEINHRCRHKRCVHPSHLEALSRSEHFRRDADVHVAAGRKHCRSGLPHGVRRSGRRFVAQKCVGPKNHYLGSFDTVEAAALAVRKFCDANGLLCVG